MVIKVIIEIKQERTCWGIQKAIVYFPPTNLLSYSHVENTLLSWCPALSLPSSLGLLTLLHKHTDLDSHFTTLSKGYD